MKYTYVLGLNDGYDGITELFNKFKRTFKYIVRNINKMSITPISEELKAPL